MKFIAIFTLFIIISLASCAQQPKTPKAWLKANTFELEPNGQYDFTEIGNAIGDKRIIALGESSHGIGKFYELKAALVQYLYEEKGFEILAMEGGVGDINLAFSNIDTLTGMQLRDHTVFGNFRAAEATPMFELIKATSRSKNPLIYTGYDTQASSSYVTKLLMKILKPYNKTLSDSLQQRFWSYSKSFQAGNKKDSIGYRTHRDIFINTSKEVATILANHSEDIKKDHDMSEFQLQILQRTLLMFQKSTNLSYQDKWKGYGLRDELMFENLQWIITEVYPNKKVIVWAHNAHIENANLDGSNTKWMGHYLKEAYADDYYALGLFAKQGNTYQHWTRKTIPFNHTDSSYLEKKMANTGKIVSFINIAKTQKNQYNEWLHASVKAYEVENMGVVSFVPSKRFDGIVTVFESDIPTYNKE